MRSTDVRPYDLARLVILRGLPRSSSFCEPSDPLLQVINSVILILRSKMKMSSCDTKHYGAFVRERKKEKI